MKKGQNFNHPEKGKAIKADPIFLLSDIDKIVTLLKNKPRDLCLFLLGINIGLRASDLVKIKLNQVKHLKPGDELRLKERKRGKHRQMNLNTVIVDSIKNLIKYYEIYAPLNSEGYLFESSRGGHLSVPYLSRLVKKWCLSVGLKGHFSSHTLRKTFGFHLRVTFKKDLAIISKALGHTNQGTTIEYLCIQPDEIRDLYKNELGGKGGYNH